MLFFLVIVLVVLALALWLGLSYVLWEEERGHTPQSISPEPFLTFQQKSSRLIRRGRYIAHRILGNLWSRFTTKVRRLFVRIVPSAHEAFGDKPEITDPTPSPFLKEIMETKEAPRPRRLPKNKKML